MSNIIPYQDQRGMAEAICKSGLFGLKTPEQVLALMAVAQAEGRHPGSVARDYHIIQGRPALKADAMLARFQEAGGRVEWTVYTDEKVEGRFSHPSGGSLTLSWTMQQARSIGLAGKDVWRQYPRAMLRARVISEAIRTVLPGVLSGVYTPEEVSDFKGVTEAPPLVLETQPVPEADVGPDGWEGVPLYLPRWKKPYSFHKSMDDWIDGYNTLLARIMSSARLSDEEKQEKRSQLVSSNSQVLDGLEPHLRERIEE